MDIDKVVDGLNNTARPSVRIRPGAPCPGISVEDSAIYQFNQHHSANAMDAESMKFDFDIEYNCLHGRLSVQAP